MTWSGRGLFSLMIALLMAYMVVVSFDYSVKARLFPAWLGSIVFVMALLQFLVDTFPATRKALSFVIAKGVSLESRSGDVARVVSDARPEQPRPVWSWRTVFGIFAAMVAFAVLMAYTSFVVAVPAFLLLFVWRVTKDSFMAALGLAVGVLAFMYLIFRVILHSTF